ncbi:SnoaL-like protein [Variovorax sp. 54]|uniref:nuclear transport factor 2 family protein n=1 Tax=Variovorax sp. 54 TaxID=2035212 RepID=UPI000C17AC32|nr:nuclear transport factor 2 family protein [Variovorax sp. 54]PIF73699.1 SnoaL-like protein [Variovorax sp. 54]
MDTRDRPAVMASVKGIEALEAIEAIRQLKARYCLCVDGQRWDELRELFTPEAATDTGGQGRSRGRDSFVDKVSTLLTGAVTLHVAGMPFITLQSSTAAHGIWTMEDRLWFPDAAAPDGWRHWQGSGRYHEDYVRVQGRWLIRTMRLERVEPGPRHG